MTLMTCLTRIWPEAGPKEMPWGEMLPVPWRGQTLPS